MSGAEVRSRPARERRDDREAASAHHKNALAKAIRYAPALWKRLSRCITNGLLEVSINAAERGMKPPMMRRSFCPSSSSIGEHWKFGLRFGATRGGLSLNGDSSTFRHQIGRLDLEWRAGHDLFGGEHGSPSA
jgi:hypothetical protein